MLQGLHILSSWMGPLCEHMNWDPTEQICYMLSINRVQSNYMNWSFNIESLLLHEACGPVTSMGCNLGHSHHTLQVFTLALYVIAYT